MKHLSQSLPFLALAALLAWSCPTTSNGGGDGKDTTKVDSILPPSHDYGTAVITLDRTA